MVVDATFSGSSNNVLGFADSGFGHVPLLHRVHIGPPHLQHVVSLQIQRCLLKASNSTSLLGLLGYRKRYNHILIKGHKGGHVPQSNDEVRWGRLWASKLVRVCLVCCNPVWYVYDLTRFYLWSRRPMSWVCSALVVGIFVLGSGFHSLCWHRSKVVCGVLAALFKKTLNKTWNVI